MLNPRQLVELDRQIGEMFGAEGGRSGRSFVRHGQCLFHPRAERDEVTALAMLQLAAAMRRRAELLLTASN